MNVTEDVTAAQRAELGQRLLVEAGRRLSRTLDLEASLQEVAELVGARARRLVRHRPARPGRCRAPGRRRARRSATVAGAPELRAPPSGPHRGRPASARCSAPASRGASTASRRDAAARRRRTTSTSSCCARSACARARRAAPAGDEVLGALSLVRRAAAPRLRRPDEELAEALARLIGDALRNARLSASATRDRARAVGRPAPDQAPRLPGCEVAAVYRPAGRGRRGRRRLLRGGRRARGRRSWSSATSRARARRRRRSARCRASRCAPPGGSPATRARRSTSSTTRCAGAAGMSLCTVAAVALPSELPGRRDGAARRASAAAARARRERPRRSASTARCSARSRSPTGRPTEVELAPGDVLVLYTDGVLDAALPGGERFGEARLRALVERAGGDLEAFAGRAIGRRARAVAAARRRGAAGDPLPRPAAAAGARHARRRRSSALLALALPGRDAARGRARRRSLGALGGPRPGALAGDALIVVSELVTNAIRHGGARTADRRSWSTPRC